MAIIEPHRLFTTIELLREVIHQVDQPKTLVRCARVNRTWHDMAMPLLWKGTSDQMSAWRTASIEELVTLAESPERFRYYISMIEDLVLLHGDAPSRSVWDPARFFAADRWCKFKAKTVIVDLGSDNMEDKWMASLIHPALTSLQLFGGYYNDEFLQLLTETCDLTVLLMDNRASAISPAGLRDYIQMNPLESLELAIGFETVTDVTVLQTIFSKLSLDHVMICPSTLDLRFFDDLTEPLNIRSLDIQIETPWFRRIFKHLPKLELFRAQYCFSGEIWDISQDILEPITTCTRLRRLHIDAVGPGADLHCDSLKQLGQKCPLVKELLIEGTGERIRIDASDLIEAIRFLPHLTWLTFWFDITNFEVSHFEKLGKYCPALTNLSLGSNLPMEILEHDTVSLPQLRMLSVNNFAFIDNAYNRAEYENRLDSDILDRRAAILLRQRMPLLSETEGDLCLTSEIGEVMCFRDADISQYLDVEYHQHNFS